jgi:hypothetical protein
MSYRRPWALVEEMNATFVQSLVLTHKGGNGGAGAAVSALGFEVLRRYHVMDERVRDALAAGPGGACHPPRGGRGRGLSLRSRSRAPGRESGACTRSSASEVESHAGTVGVCSRLEFGSPRLDRPVVSV